jgi:hypothetical protein
MTETETLHDHSQAVGAHSEASPSATTVNRTLEKDRPKKPRGVRNEF